MSFAPGKIVGWSFANNLSHVPLVAALEMALMRQENAPGLIFHSDRGVQYACDIFRQKLAVLKFLQSMSAKGNCYDNAPMESFLHTFKTELVYQTTFKTIAEAKTTIYEWTEAFFNRDGIHS